MDVLFHFKKIFNNNKKIRYIELIPWVHSDIYKLNESIEKYILKLPTNSIIAIEISKEPLDKFVSNFDRNLLNLNFADFIKIFNKSYKSKDEDYYSDRAFYRIVLACLRSNHKIIPIEDYQTYLEISTKLIGIDELKDPIKSQLIMLEMNPKRENKMAKNIYYCLNDNSKVYVITGVAHIKPIKYNLININKSNFLCNYKINYNLFKSDKHIIKKKVNLEYKLRKSLKINITKFYKKTRKLNLQLSKCDDYYKFDADFYNK